MLFKFTGRGGGMWNEIVFIVLFFTILQIEINRVKIHGVQEHWLFQAVFFSINLSFREIP
jgi:hypothetical protein